MENVKPNDWVWFMSCDRVLCGCVTEVFDNVVHIHVIKNETKPYEHEEYAIRKDYLCPSRRELMLAFDKGVGEIKRQYEKFRHIND